GFSPGSHARARAYARVSRRRECSRMFAVTAARKLPKLRVLRVRTRVRACGIPTRPRQERVKAGGLSDVSDSLDAGAARQVREESASPIRQSRSQVTACRTAFSYGCLSGSGHWHWPPLSFLFRLSDNRLGGADDLQEGCSPAAGARLAG